MSSPSPSLVRSQDVMARELRLSPRCILSSPTPSSLSSSRMGIHSPFGSSLTHSRQSSLISSQSSSSLTMPFYHHRSSYQTKLPPLKVSPTSLDMGYHTMVNTGGHDSSSPLSFDHDQVESKPVLSFKGKQSKKSSSTNNNNSTTPFFDLLSDDLVLSIFAKLNTKTLCLCAKVCRRFYFLAWEPSLWTELSLSGAFDVNAALDKLLRQLTRDSPLVCSTVERVSLNHCPRLTDQGLRLVASACPDIRKLELRSATAVTDLGVREVVTRCTLLTKLDLSGCSNVSSLDLLDPDLALTQPLLLTDLDLTDCHSLSDRSLQRLVRNSPHLLHLYLRRCVNISDQGIKRIATHCVGLRELSLSDCKLVTDFGLYELAKLGPNLRYLSVAKCERISDAGVIQIAKMCYKLRYLNVRGCEAVSDTALEAVATGCSRLRSLDIGKCDITDMGLKILANHCPNLKKLSVKSCEMVSDLGIQFVAYQCRGLVQLNIQDSPVSLEGYRTVKKYCRRCIIEHTNPGFY